MGSRTKTFDCVEMKRKAQEQIQAEWDRRKGEFSSYGEFLEEGINQSEWSRKMWERIHGKGQGK